MKSFPMGERLRQGILIAVVMVLGAVVIAMAVNHLRPSGIPLVGDWSPKAVTRLHAGDLEVIGPDDAFALFSRGQALFIDAREPGEFTGGHIPSSVNITPGEAASRLEEVRSLLGTGKTVIVYCNDVDCPKSAELAKNLRDLGAGPVRVMSEGWAGWMDRGYPYE